MKEGLKKYSDVIYSHSGINQMSILKNSKELLDNLQFHSLTCTLIFDLMRNLYIYNACIYIYSILLTGMDGAAGGQILSPRLFITQ